MILELNQGGIKIKQNSCENKNGAVIYLEFKDMIITNLDTIKVFIEGQELIQIKPNVFRIDFTLLRSTESKLEVVVQGTTMRVYQTNLVIEEYVSFGKLNTDMFPQAFIDLNNKIKILDERIKKLETTKTII